MMISRRTTSLLGAGAIAALALGGCGSSSSNKSSSSTTSSQTPSYGATTPATAAGGGAPGAVKLSANPTGALKFNVSTLHAKAGSVTLELTNPASSGLPHGIAVEGHGIDKDSKIVKAGGTATVTVDLKAGTYDFYCPVPGHKAGGMQGKLIVT
jgi:uncharacterized cupredoxin-like copper-binding protein